MKTALVTASLFPLGVLYGALTGYPHIIVGIVGLGMCLWSGCLIGCLQSKADRDYRDRF